MVVGRIMGVFYGDDGLTVLQDPEWVQWEINVLIGIFLRVGLMSNVKNQGL